MIIGQLGLNGEIKKIKGVLPIVRSAIENGCKVCILPKDNANEGAVAGSGNGVYDMSQLKPDYSGVYERMDILGKQINQLGEAISNIKIVLNSGVVAGGVTDDVDRNLGRNLFYAGRNN